MNAQLALGGFYQSRNRMPEAEQQFKHAIELAPKDPCPARSSGTALYGRRQESEAEAFLKQAKIDLSNNSEGYRMLGDFYFANGDLDKATAEYASLYSDHPRGYSGEAELRPAFDLEESLAEATKLE